MTRIVYALALASLMAGCAGVPKPLDGAYLATQPRDSSASGRTGDTIRWGGTIIAVEPEAERTCIQILARELGRDARPRQRDPDHGRFVACRNGFYDPEVFADGRDVTITGTVVAMTTREVGDYRYPMPEVAADVIYLWPPRREPVVDYYPHPSWSFWYGPAWFGPAWYYPPRPIHRPPRQRGRAD